MLQFYYKRKLNLNEINAKNDSKIDFMSFREGSHNKNGLGLWGFGLAIGFQMLALPDMKKYIFFLLLKIQKLLLKLDEQKFVILFHVQYLNFKERNKSSWNSFKNGKVGERVN